MANRESSAAFKYTVYVVDGVMKLFLDDCRKAPLGWDVVRNYDAFVEYIQNHEIPSVISFDHDLGFEHYPLGEQDPTAIIPYDTYKEKTGYHCAKYLAEQGKFPVLAIVHSWNIVGAKNIANLLGRHCTVSLEPYRD